MTDILFTVCGRAGSKGVSGKNVGDFLGIPLVFYTLAAIKGYEQDHPDVDVSVALSTDSERLRDLVGESGVAHLDIERPDELANDTSSKVAAIAHAWKASEELSGKRFDYVVDLDITSPLRTVEDVENVVERRLESKADTVFTVVPSRRNPCFNMVKRNDDGFYGRVIVSDFNTRQEAPRFFDMNASIYAYLPSFLESGKQIFDSTCDVVEMRDTAVLDIDEPGDLELMEAVARHLYETDHAYGRIRDTAREMAFR